MDDELIFHQGEGGSESNPRHHTTKRRTKRGKNEKNGTTKRGSSPSSVGLPLSEEEGDSTRAAANAVDGSSSSDVASKTTTANEPVGGVWRRLKKYRDKGATEGTNGGSEERDPGLSGRDDRIPDDGNEEDKETRRMTTTGRNELLTSVITEKQHQANEKRRQEQLELTNAHQREHREELKFQKRQQQKKNASSSGTAGTKDESPSDAGAPHDPVPSAFSVEPAMPEHKRAYSSSYEEEVPTGKKSKTVEDEESDGTGDVRSLDEGSPAKASVAERIPQWAKTAAPVVVLAAVAIFAIRLVRRK